MLSTETPTCIDSQPASVILHLVCGKIGAGKSTLAKRLALESATVLISEDIWLTCLYPNEIVSLADYVRCSERLKQVMANHVEALLIAGVSVVLDFPCNTLHVRSWARGIFEKAGTKHRLHFLDVPDEICKSRLRARNAMGEHPFETTDAEFDEITGYFVAPTEGEGFNVLRHP